MKGKAKMDRYLINTEKKLNLDKFDADETSKCPGGKEEAKERLVKIKKEIYEHQELFYAERKAKMLIVLQGMDTSGKDGTIRNVFEGVNPQGVSVVSFKSPSSEDLSHDFLWRVHKHSPEKGQIVIFNRSHYEDVLIVRVHNLCPEKVWSKRYEHIRNFEKMLADEGTAILKFYLHIDYEEQRKRLESRIKDPQKHWKLSASDIPERKLWKEYQKAYEDAIGETSRKYAPWYIVPSNNKWYRNLVISSVIRDTLKGLKSEFPKPSFKVSEMQNELDKT